MARIRGCCRAPEDRDGLTGVRRVDPGRNVDCYPDQRLAGDNQQRSDNHRRKQRTELAQQWTENEQDQTTDHHRSRRGGKARCLGHSDHRPDIDRIGAEQERQPCSHPEDSMADTIVPMPQAVITPVTMVVREFRGTD